MKIKFSPVFHAALFVIVIPAMAFISYQNPISVHILINKYNSEWSDSFFRIITKAAEGVTLVFTFSVFLFNSYRKAVALILSWLATLLTVQSLKHLVFPETPRPSIVFKDYQNFHWVEGVNYHSFHSFPSGHAADIFSIMAVVAILNSSYTYQFLAFLFALTVAFSRVYLSQHFLQDIIAGAFIGTFWATFFVSLLYCRFGLQKWPQLNSGLSRRVRYKKNPPD